MWETESKKAFKNQNLVEFEEKEDSRCRLWHVLHYQDWYLHECMDIFKIMDTHKIMGTYRWCSIIRICGEWHPTLNKQIFKYPDGINSEIVQNGNTIGFQLIQIVR